MTRSAHPRSSSSKPAPPALSLSQEPLPLPPAELRAKALAGKKTAAAAWLSFSLSGVLMAAGAVGLAVVLFPTPLKLALPPLQLHTATHQMPSENDGETASADSKRQPHTPPPAPPTTRQSRAMVPVHLPVLASANSSETMPIQQLSQDADVALELLAQLEADEQARQEELLERERLAEERRKEQERIAKIQRDAEEKERRDREALLAKKRAEESRERARLAAIANETRQNEDAARKQSQLAKQVANTPRVSRRTPPRYPTSARQAGIEGTTRIAATVTSDGKVSSPRVVASSGHRSLDSSALAAVKKWRFHPAKNGLGQAVAYQLTIPVTFRLN